MGLNPVREDQAMVQVARRLVETFTGTHSREHVEEKVTMARHRFDGRPVRDFVPILVERMVRQELRTLPQTVEVARPEATAGPREATEPPRPETAAEAPPEATEPPPPGAPEDAPPALPVRRPRLRPGGRRSVLLLVAAGLAIALVTAVAVTRGPSAPELTTVRGVIGSEKKAFFDDPQVRDALARKGVRVEIDTAGSRQIATSVDLGRYDFAFPSSAPAADRITTPRHISTKYTPFSSPMAIATFQPIADLLAKAGVAKKKGSVWTFDVAAHLRLAAKGIRWDQLKGNTAYPVRKNILVSTTDPRSSNSAAMYLAIAGYVANGDAIVQGAAAERKVLPTVSRLFLGQGYTDDSSQGPFEDYLSLGMGTTPLVCVYEAQFVDAAAHGRTKPGMVLMYPSPTVLSKHTLVPLNAQGDRVGRLLSTDPELQRLAAQHGFRGAESAGFARVVADHQVPVATDLIDVVDTPTYDTLEHLLDGVAKSYGRSGD